MSYPNSVLIEKDVLFVTKTSIYDGEMRWSAINSDTDWDLYGERMSLELYRSMLSKIKSNVPPPEPFAELVTSEYWKGGMPYLSIAHYSDGNGKAVPGDVKELFIDNLQLKAKGTLHKSPLGLAVWNSLKVDEINYKNNLDTDRIRISIAFLDLAHKHGEDGQTFRRKSFSDVCPECARGVGEKVYLDGYLVHLALTRVPVNPRTVMEAEDVMAKKSKPETRKEDAISILGSEELADELESSTLEMKSDVLVEMSDTEAVDAPVGVTDEGIQEPVPQDEVVTVTVSKLELASMIQSIVEQSLSKEEKEVIEEPATPEVEKSALELSVDKLYNVVNGVVSKAGTAEEKLQEIQPVLEEVGQTIVSIVRSSTGNPQVVAAPANDAVLEAVQSLASLVQEIGTKVATLEQKSNAQPSATRIPAPRSVVLASQAQPEPKTENPNSVKSIARRSVGL